MINAPQNGKQVDDPIRWLPDTCSSKIARFAFCRWWTPAALAVAISLSYIIAFPNYLPLSKRQDAVPGREAALAWWLENPFKQVPVQQFFPKDSAGETNHGAASHFDKKTFRAALPIAHQLFPIGPSLIRVFCHAAQVAILFFSYLFVRQHAGDPVAATYFVWALAATYAGSWGFHDWNYGDALAVALLTICLGLKSRVILAVSLLAALLTDERAIFSLPFIAFARCLPISPDAKASGAKVFMQIFKTSWLVAAVGVIYLAGRAYADLALGLTSGTSHVGSIAIVREHLYKSHPEQTLKVFELLWVLPLLLFATWSMSSGIARSYLILGLLAVLAVFLPATLVWDWDRSLYYGLPVIVFSAAKLPASIVSRRRLFFYLLFGCVIYTKVDLSLIRRADQLLTALLGSS